LRHLKVRNGTGVIIVYRILLLVSLPVVCLLAQSRNVLADPPKAERRRDAVVLHHCEVEFEKSTVLSGHSGTVTALPIQDCLVLLGDQVKAGQVLARLADRELRVQLATLKAEAESDIEIRLAESKRNETVHKMRRVDRLRGKGQGYASEEEYDGARAQLESAELTIEEAKYKRRLAHMQALEIEAQIRNREIVAPHDGIVVDSLKKVGETVIAGQPVFQVVDAEHLRVTAHANLSDYSRIRPGQRVELSPEADVVDPTMLQSKFDGRVLFVDKRIDSRSQTCRIVAAVKNQDMAFAAGLEARMTIYTADVTVDPPPQVRSIPDSSGDRKEAPRGLKSGTP
jgi:RND family efflux transporter MFP subunit